MTIFGWDLPPGAAGHPDAPWNQTGCLQITDAIGGLPPDIDLFWTEDGDLSAQVAQPLLMAPKKVGLGTFDWDDSLTDEANCAAAAKEAWTRYAALEAGIEPTNGSK